MKHIPSLPTRIFRFASLLQVSTSPRRFASLAVAFATGILACSSCQAEPLFQEQFTNMGEGNKNLASIGWSGYGGSTAADLSNATPPELNESLMITSVPGNPASPTGCLAGVMLGVVKEYAAVKTDLNLKNPGHISWRMQASLGSSVHVRLLVQVGEKWYASSNVFCPAALGSLGEFPTALLSEAESVFRFNTNASSWSEFTLKPGMALAVGETLKSGLPSSTLTGIGFYITTENIASVVRIDTLQVLP